MSKNTEQSSNVYSKDTEQMVLGCMLSSSTHLVTAFEKGNLTPVDFHLHEHQRICQALEGLYASGRPPDLHLTSEELRKRGLLDKVGGVCYLAELINLVGTSAYFESYLEDFLELSRRREFVSKCQQLSLHAQSKSNKNTSLLAAEALEHFASIASKASKKRSFPLREVSKADSVLPHLREMKALYDAGKTEGIPGLSTGFEFLDDTLGGFREDNLILLAARPSVGKTAFALNLARNLSCHQKIPTAFFSLEMTRKQLFLRLLASQSGISADPIETGRVSNSQLEQIETAITQLEESPLFINDSDYQIHSMISQMHSLAEEEGVRAFFIDYIGLIESGKNRDIRAYEIGDITRSLKNFANETKIPIVCLAQLNRQAETSHKPQLSMLRDSGNLEQDADSVIFLHRRDMIDPNDKPGQIELIVAKNRHGATASKTHQFDKKIGIVSPFVENPTIYWE